LVESGVSSLAAHLGQMKLTGTWFDRTKEFAARKRGIELSLEERAQTESVVLSPLPCQQGLASETRKALLEETVRDIEEEAALTRAQTGKSPLGVHAVLRQRPTERPRRSKRSPAPFAHGASKSARKILREAYGWFLAAYLDARERLRDTGIAAFPEGAFPPPAPFVQPLFEPG